MDRIERIRAALQRHLRRPVKVTWRREWIAANHPDGRPARLARPLTPFRGIEATGRMEVAVASAQSYAEVPGFHIVRRDPADAPFIFNTDSQDVIEDLTSHESWARVVAIAGERDNRNLRRRVRRRVFLVETRRADHHSRAVPADIASAEPKDEEGVPG
jgi:hypothetical protein